MATAYHRDQAGAPALVYSSSTGNIAHFTALKTVLKACLVTGYGVYPAAGWSLISEGVNHIVLRNGTLSGYLCLSNNSGAVNVYLSETYTGMSGDVMTGDGRKTGVAAGETIPQGFSARLLAHSSDNSSWVVVADTRTFVISIAGDSSNGELTDISFRGFTLYAGEDSVGNFLSVGGVNTASLSVNSGLGYFSSSRGFTALKHPGTGFLAGSTAIDVLIPLAFRDFNIVFTKLAKLENAQLARMFWLGGSALAGSLRGVAAVPELASSASTSQSAQWLGRNTPQNIRDLNTPIDLGDGRQYFSAVTHLGSCFLLTDNPAFW